MSFLRYLYKEKNSCSMLYQETVSSIYLLCPNIYPVFWNTDRKKKGYKYLSWLVLCITLTRATVIREEGASGEEMPS